MSVVLRTCVIPVTMTSFDVYPFVTFFMTDIQPFTIQERLIVYVWVHDRRRITDSKNLHVTCDERKIPHVRMCGGRYIRLYSIYS